MKLKKYFVMLVVMMFVYLTVFTYLNLFIYGSVMEANVPILSLTLIIPLYVSFKQKNFSRRLLTILTVFLISVSILSFMILPKYTYSEAVELISEDHIETLRKHVGEKSFIYKGDYYIKTTNGSYSFDIKEGMYKGVEDDFK